MKTRILALAFAALCSLIFSSRAAAQGCYLILTPHFSEYTNRTLDDSNNNIHQTVELDGYATFGSSASCPMYRAVHTPSVRNVIGSYGGTSYGPGGCASCYFSYSTALDVIVLPGVTYISEQGATMGCNLGGNFWSVNNLINFEVAYTRFVTGGYTPDPGPPPTRFYNVSPYCTAATTPPDWNAAGLYWLTTDPPLIPTDVVDGKTICARVGTSGPWTCLPVGKFTGGSWNFPWPLGNCTHNP